MEVRICTSCKRELPSTDFYTYKANTKRGYKTQSQCRMCKSRIRNANCTADPYQYMNRATQQLKHSRLKRDPYILFTAEPEDIHKIYDKQDGKCALSGIKMTHHRDGSGIPKPYNISIDRIDSDGDYTPENIQLVCNVVNFMKGSLSDADFIAICEAVYRNHKRE